MRGDEEAVAFGAVVSWPCPPASSETFLRARLAARTSPLPEGTLPVGAGLVLLGLTAYAFFVVAFRALGPERYASLSVLWTLVFFAVPGFFFPLEQEVGRAVSARRAVGLGGGPVVRRASVAGAALVAGLLALSGATAGPMLDRFFDGDVLLFVGLLVALPVYGAAYLARGVLSGNGRFGPYGLLLAVEGTVRVLAAAALAVVGVHRAGPYGLLIGLAPLVAMAIALPGQRQLLPPGPDAPWGELSGALGWLLAGAVLSQGFVNASVPVVKVLASDAERALAGQFQVGLIMSRIPLFLFQAVQAALLPKLAGLAASGRSADFRTGLRRLIVVVVALGVVATVGAFAVGPQALQVLFGSRVDLLGHDDLGYLAAASAAYMLALALSQALIALCGHARAALGWAAAIVTLAVVTAAGDDLLRRVELGLLAGAGVAVVVMAGLLAGQMRAGAPETVEPLVEALSPERQPVEP